MSSIYNLTKNEIKATSLYRTILYTYISRSISLFFKQNSQKFAGTELSYHF